MSSRTVFILVLLVVIAVAGGIFLLQRDETPGTTNTTNTPGNTNAANANVSAATPLFILGVDPAKGPTSTNTVVTVTGSGFESGVKAFFGEDEATVTFKSATELSVTTPKHSKGTVGLRVQNPDGKTASFPDAFTFE